MMKDFPIKEFGSKLMVASKSVSNIPDKYLSYARNARIYDGGIWPRRGKSLLYESSSASNNKGGFSINGRLYQIAEGKIFEISTVDGTRTEKATLGYDQRVDVLNYQAQKWTYNSLATAETHSYSVPTFVGGIAAPKVGKIKYVVESGVAKIVMEPFPLDDHTALQTISLTLNNGTYAYPVIRLWYAWTTGGADKGTGRDVSATYYALEPGQYMQLSSEQYTGSVKLDVGYYTSVTKVVIASKNQTLRVYDGETTVSTVSTAPADNSGILEFCRNYSFLAAGNVLYISRPVTAANPEYAYDFSGAWSQQITYEDEIVALKATLNGLYVNTKGKWEFLGANALQNVAGSATFISTPIGNGAESMDNQLVVASGDKIFTVTKNLQVQTVNYVPGTENAQIGELSARPVVGIRQFLETVDTNQPTGFGFYNENDKTVQFHLRSIGSPFNDLVLVYDLVNDTWNVDTAKNYNTVVKIGYDHYGFSDVNASVYRDDNGNSDAGVPIEFRIRTNNFMLGTPVQKLFGGFFSTGAIHPLTTLDYLVNIDDENVFEDSVSGDPSLIPDLGEIGVSEIGGQEIAGWTNYFAKIYPFDRVADEGRIYKYGKRVQLEITSSSLVQDFILDVLWVRAQGSPYVDQADKF